MACCTKKAEKESDPRYKRPKTEQGASEYYPSHASFNPQKEMRLLELLPGNFQDKIRCNLSQHPLPPPPPRIGSKAPSSDLVEYEALSYVWGRWTNWKPICVDGVDNYPVTENLFCALKRLRRPKKSRRLWIDQICIDQRKIPEAEKILNQEIYHIDQIFGSQPSQVVIWLGETEKTPKQSKDLLDAIESNSKMVDYPWWDRAWVIQEFVLAGREPRALFGPYEEPWSQVDKLAGEWSNRVSSRLGQRPGVAYSLSIGRMKDIKAKSERNIFTLSAALNKARTRDDEDKIFCILSSLPAQEKEVIGQGQDKCVARVFAKATYASIKSSGNLGIFGLVSGPGPFKRDEDKPQVQVPSWTVDFTFPDNERTYRILPGVKQGRRQRLKDKVYLSLNLPFNELRAAQVFGFEGEQMGWCRRQPRSTAQVDFNSADYRCLRIGGLAFDQVQSVVSVNDSLIDEGHTFASFSVSMAMNLNTVARNSTNKLVGYIDWKLFNKMERKILEPLVAYLENHDPYAAVFSGASGSTSGRGEQPRPYSDFSNSEIRTTLTDAMFRLWDKGARPEGARRIDDFDLSTIFSAMKIEFEHRNDQDNADAIINRRWKSSRGTIFKWSLQCDTAGHVFFQTRSGFVGLAPKGLRAIDEIILPYGSQFPIAIRQSGKGFWSFVGFLYVRGIMDGELWDCFPEMKLQERTYTLY